MTQKFKILGTHSTKRRLNLLKVARVDKNKVARAEWLESLE